MNKLWEKIASFIYQYGKESAGMVSYRGSYEAPVPQQLRDELEAE